MSTLVTLADILVSDARPEAEGNPFRVLLAPLASTLKDTAAPAAARQGGSKSLDGIDFGKSGDSVDGGPLMSVTAKTDGDGGALDAEIKLKSFAFNVMIDAIKDTLVVWLGVNIALLNMLGVTEGGGSKKHPTGGGGWQESGGMDLEPLEVLEEEPKSEVRENMQNTFYFVVCS